MKKLFYIALFIINAMQLLNAQNFWTQPNGPFGPNESDGLFISSNGTVYMYGDSVMKSTDDGDTWTGIKDSTFFFVTFFQNDDAKLYGGDFKGLFVSANNGENWSAVNLGISPISVYTIAKSQTGDFFVGTNNHVFRSTDNGTSWNRYSSGLTQNNVYAFGFGSNNIVIAGTYSGLFRSTNNGVNWSTITITANSFKKISVTISGVMFAGSDKGLFRSTDNGANWMDVSAGLADSNVYALDTDSLGNVYAGTLGTGIYKSTNNGDAWTLISSGLSYPFADYIAAAPNGKLFVSTRAALNRSTDGGATWTSITSKFPPLGARGIYMHSSGAIYAGTFAGQFRSTDNGTTWTQIQKGLPHNIVVSWLEMPGNVLLAGTYYGGLYSSSDGGDTWTLLSQKGLRVEGLVKDGNGTLYHANDQGAYKSTDNGTTWTLDTAGLGAKYNYTMIAAKNGSRYIAGNQGLYRWKSAETMWTRVLGSGSFFLTAIVAEVPNGMLFTSVGYSPLKTDYGVWRSTDNGDSWQHITTPDSSIQQIISNSAGTIILASKTGVYKSSTNGDSWSQVATNVWPGTTKTHVSVNAFSFAGDGTLWAATSAAIYKSSQPLTSIDLVSSEIPQSFTLQQNYPNPFNPSTNIGFSVPSGRDLAKSGRIASASGGGFVSLKVYDILGREVATLVNENLKAGIYNYNFDASKLSSGVYFYRLQTNNFVETKKMILLR